MNATDRQLFNRLSELLRRRPDLLKQVEAEVYNTYAADQADRHYQRQHEETRHSAEWARQYEQARRRTPDPLVPFPRRHIKKDGRR